ncbi:MAG: HPr family phosphocarrier protein [Acidobacteria bacterium]|nr:MAG: HPr family phosphocarrier protein [Acidobacteriota bacterium]
MKRTRAVSCQPSARFLHPSSFILYSFVVLRRIIRLENRFSLHARAAARLVRTASRYQCEITLAALDNKKETDAKSILGVMLLAGCGGTELQITAEGADEEAAMVELLRLVEENFEDHDETRTGLSDPQN